MKECIKIPSSKSYLSPRLLAICEMAKGAKTVADIGTDHAYVPIYLIEECGAFSALACDINRGPLLRADANIEKFGFSQKIKTRLSDGLKNIGDAEADTVIIAGMGGTLIAQILTDAPHMQKGGIRFILQPMTAIDELRRFLYANGYKICDESLCPEDDKLYTIMSVEYIGEKSDYTDELYFHIGKRLIEKRDPHLLRLLKNKINEFKKITEGLEKALQKEELKKKSEDLNLLLEKLYALEKELTSCLK